MNCSVNYGSKIYITSRKNELVYKTIPTISCNPVLGLGAVSVHIVTQEEILDKTTG